MRAANAISLHDTDGGRDVINTEVAERVNATC